MAKLFFILCIFSISFYSMAHGGRTDSQGGHHDRKNGGYHYHHGRPAHSHYQGHCPYDADDDLFKLSLIGGVLVFSYLKITDKNKRA